MRTFARRAGALLVAGTLAILAGNASANMISTTVTDFTGDPISVLVTLDSRNFRYENRAVLHRVEMTPASLAGVLTRSLILTLGAKKSRSRIYRPRHPNRPLFIQAERHVRHSPWISDPQ